MFISDIANLISIRAFLLGSIDNLSIKLSREEIRTIQNKIPQLDKAIINASVKLDISAYENNEKTATQRVVNSTTNVDDIKTIEDLDKMSAAATVTPATATLASTDAKMAKSEHLTQSSKKTKSVKRVEDNI